MSALKIIIEMKLVCVRSKTTSLEKYTSEFFLMNVKNCKSYGKHHPVQRWNEHCSRFTETLQSNWPSSLNLQSIFFHNLTSLLTKMPNLPLIIIFSNQIDTFFYNQHTWNQTLHVFNWHEKITEKNVYTVFTTAFPHNQCNNLQLILLFSKRNT